MPESKECRLRAEYYVQALEEDMRKLKQDTSHLANSTGLDVNDFVQAFCDLRAIADGVKTVRTMLALQMNAEIPGTASLISAHLADALPALLDLEYLAQLGQEDISDVIESVATKVRSKKRGK